MYHPYMQQKGNMIQPVSVPALFFLISQAHDADAPQVDTLLFSTI